MSGGTYNPTAFPIPESDGNYAELGMTLLDYYAGQALAGAIANGVTVESSEVAKSCFDFAEAMLRERSRRGHA